MGKPLTKPAHEHRRIERRKKAAALVAAESRRVNAEFRKYSRLKRT